VRSLVKKASAAILVYFQRENNDADQHNIRASAQTDIKAENLE
jgi:hypothetical protein